MIEAFIRGDNRPRPAGRRPSIRAIPSSGQLDTFREPNRKLRAWFHSAKTAPERRARCILEGRVRSKMIAMKSTSAAREFPIVCVGGSAGGLDAYTRLLRHLPADMGVAIVIVNHLRTVATLLHEILPRYTVMPVELITERLLIQPNRVFVIPEQRDLHVLDGEFLLKPISKPDRKSVV